jgi:predicted transposase YdaD
MLKQGLSIQNIASATGLSAKEVKKIQEDIK